MKDSGLIVFLKNQEEGKVKTRLAKTMGNKKTLEIYQQLINYTFQVIDSLESKVFVYFSENIEDKLPDDTDQFIKRVQQGSDLGQRMNHAFEEVLLECERVVIIGTDCGVLTSKIIREAFAVLHRVDVVIGPTEDGGYYLLGMKKKYNELFSNISWSSDAVLDQTMQKIDQMSLSCTWLPTLFDVDHEVDWERLGWV